MPNDVAGTDDLPPDDVLDAPEGREPGDDPDVDDRPRFRAPQPRKVAFRTSADRGRDRGDYGGRDGGYGKRSRVETDEKPYKRVAGLYENDNGLGGKTLEHLEIDTEMGTVVLPEGTRFKVFENTYKRNPKEPDYNLVVMKEAARPAGARYGRGTGGGGRFGRR